MKKGMHIMNPNKAQKGICYRTTFFILYSIYKMICLKSPKSCEFVKTKFTNSAQNH